MRGRYIFLIFLLFSFCLPADVRAGINVFKSSAGNLYFAGGNISITESTSGDMVAAGGSLNIAGDAGDDLLAAGGSLRLSGNVGSDARLAGGDISVESEVGGEMMIGGGQVVILPGTSVKKDLFIGAGSAEINGVVGNDLKIAAGEAKINGTVHGNVDARTGELIIGKDAVINGDLRYQSPNRAKIEEGATIKGKEIFTLKEYPDAKKRIPWLIFAWWITKLLATITAALAIYFLFRKRTEEFAALALNRFGKELLTGFVILVVVPVAAIILFSSVLGFLLGLTGLFFYIAFIFLSSILGGVVFSSLLGKFVFKKDPYLTWPLILLGIFVYQVIGIIPFLGWIFRFVFFLVALGAASGLFYRGIKGLNKGEV